MFSLARPHGAEQVVSVFTDGTLCPCPRTQKVPLFVPCPRCAHVTVLYVVTVQYSKLLSGSPAPGFT